LAIKIHPETAQILNSDPRAVSDFLLSVIEHHARLLSANSKSVLKDSPESAVTLVKLSGFPKVCVKELRWRGRIHALKGFLRPTQGERSFRNGWRLREAGFGVAAPLALITDRRLGIVRGQWVVMEVIPGAVELDRYVLKREAERWQPEEKFGRFLGSMHAAGVFHSDLKTCNILVSEDPPQESDPSDMGQDDAIVSGIENCAKDHPPLTPPVKGGDEKTLSSGGRGMGEGDLQEGRQDAIFSAVHHNKAPASGKAVRFSLLDYDEVRFFRHVSGRRRIKNLIQIFLSTPVAIKATQRLLFLNEYALHAGLSPYEKRETARVVIEAASGKKILYVGFNGDVREQWDSTPSSSGSALEKPENLSP